MLPVLVCVTVAAKLYFGLQTKYDKTGEYDLQIVVFPNVTARCNNMVFTKKKM